MPRRTQPTGNKKRCSLQKAPSWDVTCRVQWSSSETTSKTPLQVGDKVACAVHGGKFPDKGAFAQYARAESDLCFKVPDGMGMDAASNFGVPWGTALHVSHLYYQAFDSRLHLEGYDPQSEARVATSYCLRR